MDEFMDEYYRRVYFVGNTFCKNDIILAFFSHCNFSFIYNLFIKNKFPTIISCFKTIIPKNNYKKYACGSNFSKYVCVCVKWKEYILPFTTIVYNVKSFDTKARKPDTLKNRYLHKDRLFWTIETVINVLLEFGFDPQLLYFRYLHKSIKLFSHVNQLWFKLSRVTSSWYIDLGKGWSLIKTSNVSNKIL